MPGRASAWTRPGPDDEVVGVGEVEALGIDLEHAVRQASGSCCKNALVAHWRKLLE